MARNTLAIRWSDNDRYWGPFTYARGDSRRFAIMLGSGDGDDYPHCRLRFSAFRRSFIIRLPGFILRPAREWVDTSKYQWANGSGGYWDTHEREFGFTIFEGAVHWHYGRQTHDSATTRSKCWFMPWRSWRHVRRSFYGLEGEHVATLPDRKLKGLPIEERRTLWDEERQVEESCPTVTFRFKDFDGEELTATTRIEEREWRLGEGRFRWLSLFRRPRIDRSLCIQFSGETGQRKGSWKGGTIGHAITMVAGEKHWLAFRRYCAEHGMMFLGISDSDGNPKGEDAQRLSAEHDSAAIAQTDPSA